MSTATPSTPPEPADQGESARPDLQVVRDPNPSDTGESVDPVGEPAAELDEDAEPLLDSTGQPVTPQAPWDVRLREQAIQTLHGLPAFGSSPPSFAESISYSQEGDWATSENGAKRAVHGLATVITYLVTYPLVDVLGKHRSKPGPFALVLLIVLAASYVLALVL